MGHVFSHLSKTDRYKIEALLNQGHTKREIADELHVHISTIYREIKRARQMALLIYTATHDSVVKKKSMI